MTRWSRPLDLHDRIEQTLHVSYFSMRFHHDSESYRIPRLRVEFRPFPSLAGSWLSLTFLLCPLRNGGRRVIDGVALYRLEKADAVQ